MWELLVVWQRGVKVKNSVGWSRRLRIAEVVPKAVTGKEVGGWSEAGRRGVPGSVLSNPVEVRDRSQGPPRALTSFTETNVRPEVHAQRHTELGYKAIIRPQPLSFRFLSWKSVKQTLSGPLALQHRPRASTILELLNTIRNL